MDLYDEIIKKRGQMREEKAIKVQEERGNKVREETSKKSGAWFTEDIKYDDLGIRIHDTIDYYTYRAYKNAMRLKKPLRRDGFNLYMGNDLVFNTPASVKSLVATHKNLQAWQTSLIYNRLLEVVPIYIRGMFIISDHLYWDIEKGQVCRTNKPMYEAVPKSHSGSLSTLDRIRKQGGI